MWFSLVFQRQRFFMKQSKKEVSIFMDFFMDIYYFMKQSNSLSIFLFTNSGGFFLGMEKRFCD